MFYTVYQVVNKINGKVYVGKHVTTNLDDGYMGSGKLIRRTIKKYGSDNFFKTIIAVYDNENLMNAAEKFMVAYDPDTTYNLCEGGKGGWGYVNKTGKNLIGDKKKAGRAGGAAYRNRLISDIDFRNLIHERCRNKLLKKPLRNGFKNKNHTQETKRLMAEKASLRVGSKNSSYGTMWITNGSENRKIKKTDAIPENWRRGRVHISA